MNRIILLGRLTTDPEKKVFEDSQKVMVRFFLAVDRDYKNAEGEREADFVPVVIWGKKAENAFEQLKKGSLVSVGGKLRTKSYEDKDGNKRFIFEVIGDEIHFAETFNKKGQEAM